MKLLKVSLKGKIQESKGMRAIEKSQKDQTDFWIS